MASLFSQSARSGRLTRPISNPTRSPLRTWPKARRWAEPQTPPIGTPPGRVGVAPPTVGLSNGGRPGNRAMGLTNEEASGQETKPLPPEEKVWLSGPALERRCDRGGSVGQFERSWRFAKQRGLCVRRSWWERTFSVQAFPNLASKASEWLLTRALQTVVVMDFGSWVRVPPW